MASAPLTLASADFRAFPGRVDGGSIAPSPCAIDLQLVPRQLGNQGRWSVLLALMLPALGCSILDGRDKEPIGKTSSAFSCEGQPAGTPCQLEDGRCIGTGTCDGRDNCLVNVWCDDRQPCTLDECIRGECSNRQVDEGTRCDDSDPCTSGETCDRDGRCSGGGTTDCDDRNPCTTDACQLPDGCYYTNAATSTPCEDYDACTLNDHCDGAGRCTGGGPQDCSDSNECTIDNCDSYSGCWYANADSSASCSDNSVCTSPDNCDGAGHCLGGPDIDCDDAVVCTIDSCSPSTGCEHTGAAPSGACDDDNACTSGDHCNGSGTCIGGGAVSCDDSNLCTSDSCDQVYGCQYVTVPCDDGNACTTDSCQPSLGCQHASVSCNDSNACTDDGCNALTGCTHSQISCDDGNVCTFDDCAVGSGCTHAPALQVVTCDDNSVCTSWDHCDGFGACIGTPVSCDDSNVCTVDQCDLVTGCGHTPAGVQVTCNDNNVCTSPDHCNGSGSCIGGAIDPSDGNPCTADSCSQGTGVIHEPVALGTPCPDQTTDNGDELCNASATCLAGTSSLPVLSRVGGQDSNVTERRLGAGNHPVASGSQGMAVAFLELQMKDNSAPRLGVATFSLLGEGRGVGRIQGVLLEADPVLAALPDGSFALAYTAFGLDGDGLGVALVKVSSTGGIVGTTKVANQTTLYGQKAPDIIWTGSQLVVAWEDESQTSGRRICSREFSQTLAPLAAEHCEPIAAAWASRVSLTPVAGQSAMAWRSDTQTTNSVKLKFASHLSTFDLTASTLAETPTLLGLDAGHVLIVYTEGCGEQDAVVVNAAGAVTTSTLLNTSGEERYAPVLASTSDGIYLSWREPAVMLGSDWDPNFDELYIQKIGSMERCWMGRRIPSSAASRPRASAWGPGVARARCGVRVSTGRIAGSVGRLEPQRGGAESTRRRVDVVDGHADREDGELIGCRGDSEAAREQRMNKWSEKYGPRAKLRAPAEANGRWRRRERLDGRECLRRSAPSLFLVVAEATAPIQWWGREELQMPRWEAAQREEALAVPRGKRWRKVGGQRR